MGILELRDITLELDGKPILNNLSVDFWEGHVHALIGPNGAGKSTLANTIMGLPGYTHHSGDILLDGESLRGVPVDERARRGITLAWQEPARFEGLRMDRFIAAGAKVKSREKAKEMLARVGLDPERYIMRKVDKTLSGGERKRVELASILAMEPRLVLMDEPDSGIDVEALQRIFDALADFKAMGTTVIMITHSMAVLEHAEHAFLLCNGRILDKGSVGKISGYFVNNCIPCDHENVPWRRRSCRHHLLFWPRHVLVVAGDAVVDEIAADLADRTLVEDAAVAKQEGVLGVLEHRHAVGDHDHRGAHGLEVGEGVEDALQGLDVDARVGLVHEYQTWFHGQDRGELDPLPLSSRERLVDLAHDVAFRVEPHAAEHLLNLLARLHLGARGDEAVHAQTLEARRLLPGERDAAPRALIDGHAAQRLAVEQDVAAVVGVAGEAHDGVGKGGLAGAVGPDERVDVAFPEVDAEPVEYGLAAQLQRDVVQFKDPHRDSDLSEPARLIDCRPLYRVRCGLCPQ